PRGERAAIEGVDRLLGAPHDSGDLARRPLLELTEREDAAIVGRERGEGRLELSLLVAEDRAGRGAERARRDVVFVGSGLAPIAPREAERLAAALLRARGARGVGDRVARDRHEPMVESARLGRDEPVEVAERAKETFLDEIL